MSVRKSVRKRVLLAFLFLKLLTIIATAERALTIINITKNEMKNWIRDEWLNNCLVNYMMFCWHIFSTSTAYVSIDVEKNENNIIQCFKNMKKL